MKNLIDKIKNSLKVFLLWCKEMGKAGQSAIEYLLIFAAVVLVVVAATNPQGFLTKTLNKSLDLAVNGLTTMSNQQYFPNCPETVFSVLGAPVTFPETASGDTRILACPLGYAGNVSSPCNEGTWGAIDSSGCVLNVCTGFPPANSQICPGDSVGLSGDTPVTLVSSCGPAKCEYTCDAGYTASGGTCVPNGCPSASIAVPGGSVTLPSASHGVTPSVSCLAGYGGRAWATCWLGNWINSNNSCYLYTCTNLSSINTSRATQCPGTTLGLSADTPWTLGVDCSLKCTYICDLGTYPSGGACIPYVCTGTPLTGPEYVQCIDTTVGLTADLPWTLVSACDSAQKCTYTCISGYYISGGVCVPIPPNQCLAATLEVGSGFTYNFPTTNNGDEAIAAGACGAGYAGSILSCPARDQWNYYTGIPSRKCIAGVWQSTENPCVRDECQAQSLPIGAGLTGVFPLRNNGASASLPCPGPAVNGPVITGGNPTRVCSNFYWGPLINPCVCQADGYGGCCVWIDDGYGSLAQAC